MDQRLQIEKRNYRQFAVAENPDVEELPRRFKVNLI